MAKETGTSTQRNTMQLQEKNEVMKLVYTRLDMKSIMLNENRKRRIDIE